MTVRGADPHEEATLWARWREDADASARASLIERYVPYATATAAKLYARRGPGGVEFEEFRQFAMVGLLESVERYHPGRGAQFTTFALPRIRGAILNGLQHLSERQEQAALRRRITSERLESLKPDAPTLSGPQQLLAELEDIGLGLALGMLLEGTGMVRGPEEALPADAYAAVELRQLGHRVWGMVDHLGAREREIIRLHYRGGKTFDEIASSFGLTKGRISQVHRDAVSRLRALIGKGARCDVAY